VLKAIWQPKLELIMGLICLIVMEYYFTIVGYVVFFRHYD